MTSGGNHEGESFPQEEAAFGDNLMGHALPLHEVFSKPAEAPPTEPLTDLGLFNELPETKNLATNTEISAELANDAQTDPAIEAKKTRCSNNILDYFYEGSDETYEREAYEKLTKAQKNPNLRLRPDQFRRGCAELRDIVQSPEDLVTLKYIMAVHDGGKNRQLVADMGLTGKGYTHDDIIELVFIDPRFLHVRKKYFPTFDKLNADQRQIVKRVMEIRFNYPQAMQGEAPAAMYANWPDGLDPKIAGMAKWEAKLDISGVLGHLNEESSRVLTANTFEYMEMMDAALDAPGLTPVERQKMYLFNRLRAYGVTEEYLDDPANEAEMIAVARIACQLRLETDDQFAFLHQRFNRLPATVTTIIIEELNKTGIDDAAALAEYSPAMLAALLKALDGGFAVPFAQFLQEISVANAESREPTERGIIAAQLGELVAKLNTNQIQGGLRKVEFVRQGESFVPRELQPALRTVEELPFFDVERFRGKDLIVVTNSGSDALSGYLTAKLLQHTCNANIQAITVNRLYSGDKPKNIVNAQEWPEPGVAWQKLTGQTFRKPGEKWRFAEIGILQDPDAPPVYWAAKPYPRASDPESHHSGDNNPRNADLERLIDRYAPDFVLGIDPGFDSGWTEDEVKHGKVGLPHLLTAADHQLIRHLGRLDAERQIATPYEPKNFMVMNAPGLYGPPDSLSRLMAMGAQVLEQQPDNSYHLIQSLARLGMMGAPNKEIYSTTIAVQRAAILGQFGIQAIELPEEAHKDRWRMFFDITEAMKEFVIAPARDHWRVISSPDSPHDSAY